MDSVPGWNLNEEFRIQISTDYISSLLNQK